MKSWPIAALCTLALSACVGASARGGDEPDPAWITDYGKAKASARAAGKPIFLVFRCER